MAISYFGDNNQYVMNHYRSRKINDGYLLTTDYGSWVFLDKKEYDQVSKGDVKGELLETLKEKGLVIDNVDDIVHDYREKCGFLFQGTSLHIVVPTLRCNHKCVYCHAMSRKKDAKNVDMDEETAKKTVDFILQSPSTAITIEFQGGEPLLRFDLIKYIVKYANEQNVTKDLQYSVVTNLTLMTEEMLEFFQREGIGICTSLDGHAAVHNKNRQDHDKTVHWIKRIKDKYRVNAMLLATKHTLPHHKEIVDEYIKMGLPRIWIKPLNKLGYAKDNWDKIGITSEEYLEFWKKALEYIIKKKSIKEHYTTIILRKILTKDSVNFTDLQSPCGAAIGQLAYSYDGNIYTCDEGRLYDVFKLGTVDNKYKEIIGSGSTCAIVRASINDNPVCETCAYKPICGLCPVCSYAETGNVISKLPDRRCRILIGMFDHIFDKLINDVEYRNVFMSWI